MKRLMGFIVAAAVLLAAPAFGQPQVVTVTATPERTQVTPGDRLAIAVVMDFKEGYHAWPAAVQDALAPEIAEFAYHTDIVPGELPSGIQAVGNVQWPTPHEVSVADPTGMQATVKAKSYSGRAIAYVPVAIAADAAAGPLTVDLTVSFQACDDKMCLMPEDRTVQVTLEVVQDAVAAAASATDAALFAGFDARSLADVGSSGSRSGGGAAPDPATPAAARPSLFGYEMPDFAGPLGLAVLLLISALGGAVLNLTPCVLPVIPIKIMTLTKHAAEPSRRMALGLWMALGVVAFWAAIGLPMAFFSSALDPSRLIFGNWYIVLGLGVLIATMGVGIMGLFEIKLPQSVYRVNPRADSAWGSFLFGVMTAVLGLPCFGFVAGGLLAGAAVLGATKIMIIFTGLGVGMAAPYLVLSAYPALIQRIPRTGPASELVKQVMGLLLLAAAAFFITAGVKGLLIDMPYLKESIGWWAVTLFVVVAAVWLVLRTFQITKKALPRLITPPLAMVSVAALVAFSYGLTSAARTGTWVEYTPARLDQARETGKIVVVDFTADWCIICKSLKQTVLDRGEVQERLSAGDVVTLKVDLTSTTAPGWGFLGELGQTGVPTLAIYGPGVNEPIVYNAYTPDLVLRAIDRAASPATARSTVGAP